MPSTGSWARSRLVSLREQIEHEMTRRKAGRKARTPLTSNQREFLARLIRESEEKQEAWRNDPRPRDEQGNTIVDPGDTAWAPSGMLAAAIPLYYDAVKSRDEERQRQCEEFVRSLLSTPEDLRAWLREAAQARGTTLDAIAEQLSLHTSLKKGRVSSRAAARNILRFWPETFTVHKTFGVSEDFWGNRRLLCILRSDSGGQVRLWLGHRGAHRDIREGHRVTIESATVAQWGDDEREVWKGFSYPSRTRLRRVTLARVA
jgi:hypothetical protein